MVSSTGESYNAQRVGPGVVVRGASPGTSVRLRRVPAFVLQEIYKRDGKIVGTTTTTVVDESRAIILEETPGNR